MSVPPSRASGWYPDPHNATLLRYWNGRVWTGRTMPAAPAVTAPAVNAPGAGPTPVPPTPAKAPGVPVGGIVAISVIEEMGGF